MRRLGIVRADYLPAVAFAAAPGIAILTALWLFGAVGFLAALAGIGLMAVVALVLALVWAQDVAALRWKIAAIGHGESQLHTDSVRTPTGAILTRLLAEADQRSHQIYRGLEDRALLNEHLVDALPEPILLIGQTRRILHANRAAEDLFGHVLPGRSLIEVIRSPAVFDGVRQALTARQPLDVDLELRRPVRRQMRARMASLSFGDAGGDTVVLILQDLTAIRQAEQMRVDFVANVSHELRTPLTSLRGFIETMRGPAREDVAARDRFLLIMEEQTGRMGRLVDDLLSLSRIELEEHKPPSDIVEMAPLVGSVLDALSPVAATRPVTFEQDWSEPVPAIVGDADQVSQVLRNLLENAIKYGREGGTVRIRMQPDGEMLTIGVRDDGEGIAREHLHRLTERFYRVDAARSRRAGGTGLGLAIVKHIVNRHRGRINVTSTPGEGSEFVVEFPIRRKD